MILELDASAWAPQEPFVSPDDLHAATDLLGGAAVSLCLQINLHW